VTISRGAATGSIARFEGGGWQNAIGSRVGKKGGKMARDAQGKKRVGRHKGIRRRGAVGAGEPV